MESIHVGKVKLEFKLENNIDHYSLNSYIPLIDGMYVGEEGWFVVANNIVVLEGKNVFNKWGKSVSLNSILNASFFITREKEHDL